MKNFKYTNSSTIISYDKNLKVYMIGVYNYVATALLVTGLTASSTASSDLFLKIIYNLHGNQIIGYSPLGWIILTAPLGIALTFSLSIHKLSIFITQVLFWAYAILLGLSLNSLFLIYTTISVAKLFFITAILFAGMSLYGYTSKSNLSGLGFFLTMVLMGIFIAYLVNVFLQSSGLDFIISIIGVLIFTGLTAVDTQRIYNIYYIYKTTNKEKITKYSILGALTLYLDFISIFIHLLKLFGEKKERS